MTAVSGATPTSMTTGAASIPVSLAAGQEADVTVTVAPLGEITGSIKGYVWREGYLTADPTDKVEDPNFSTLVGMIRMEYRATNSTDPWTALPSALTVPQDNNQNDLNQIDFSLGGLPPGDYEFRVVPTDPNFPYKLDAIDPAELDVVFPGTGVYAMTNGATNAIGELALERKPVALDVNLFSALGVPLPADFDVKMKVFKLDGVEVQIGPDNQPGTGLWPLDGSNGNNPDLALQPGTYTLEFFDHDDADGEQVDQVYRRRSRSRLALMAFRSM